jgi:hypothetical protein
MCGGEGDGTARKGSGDLCAKFFGEFSPPRRGKSYCGNGAGLLCIEFFQCSAILFPLVEERARVRSSLISNCIVTAQESPRKKESAFPYQVRVRMDPMLLKS